MTDPEETKDDTRPLAINLEAECPKCGVSIAASLANDGSWRPSCATCGWSATFSMKVTF